MMIVMIVVEQRALEALSVQVPVQEGVIEICVGVLLEHDVRLGDAGQQERSLLIFSVPVVMEEV